jgi:hypothetical protein
MDVDTESGEATNRINEIQLAIILEDARGDVDVNTRAGGVSVLLEELIEHDFETVCKPLPNFGNNLSWLAS